MLNGCRVDVRHAELALGAVDVEASKKLVSIYFYRNHNYNEAHEQAYFLQSLVVFEKEVLKMLPRFRIRKKKNMSQNIEVFVMAFIGAFTGTSILALFGAILLYISKLLFS